MHRLVLYLKRLALVCSGVVLMGFSPLVITSSRLAAADATPEKCSPSTNYGPGVHVPTGSDAGTFTYECPDQPYPGLYFNGYYTYDPVTQTRTARYAPNYSYSCSTGQWTMDHYDYSPALKTFVKSRVKTSDPGLPTNCPVPDPPAVTTSDATDASVGNTGNGSQNTSGNNLTVTSGTTNTNTLGMNNVITSTAVSGNADVLGNTTADGATTGDASAIATIANLLQSTSNVFGPGTVTFTADINGNVNGDFMFDPSALITNTGDNSQNSSGNSIQVNNTDSNTTNAQINNDVNVNAASGDAKVAGNTEAGSAQSGNATAIVNLLNLINSTVSAGHSFVGVVNINGNLNGDILLPQSFIDQLLASSGNNSTNTATNSITNNSTATNDTTANISNNVNSSAQSGTATVAGNTEAGKAQSGSAGTNVTIMNLTGSNVVGTNDLLVFVNVLGHWVGMIVNAPAGSTTVELGGGISGTGANSQNSSNNNVNLTNTTSNTNNFGINNNVNVGATSGDATVRNNTVAGDATTGNAHTAVNILNMAGSNLSLSNWFGVLFINVFGDWTGSFGVNTSAGDPVNTSSATQITPAATSNPASAASPSRTFASFVAHTASTGGVSNPLSSPSTSVLGTTTSVAKKVVASTLPTPDNASHASYLLPAIGVSVAALMLLGEQIPRLIRKLRKI